ncbi:putative ribonuclease H-like domain-containing protein, partial [Tanacetum coccineum]
KNEVLFSEEVAVLKREVACKDYEIHVLKSEFEKVKQEKEGIEFKIDKFDKASKYLDKLLGSQITAKGKKGLGYSAVPPPHPLIYNRPNKLDLSYSGLDEFKGFGSKDSKKESNVVYDKKSDDFKENSDNSLVKEQVSKDTSSFVESLLNVDKETVFPIDKKVESVKPKNHEKPVKKSVRYAEMYRSQTPRGNQRNWNGQKSNQLGSDFVMYNKACFICGSFNHVQAQCKYHQRERMAQAVNTARPQVVNTARPKTVKTATPNSAVINVVRVNQANVVKASACWVWRPTKPNGKPQQDDTGFVDSGCLRHMTENIAYLSDFKEFDRGYVTFGGGAHGGRISGKGTLKTDSLDFKDVYFVNELNINLFSVSQMYEKKNYVLFTDTECLVLSPNFKLPDENQILLKIPRKDNMYSFDMKNIVSKESLTCLVAKATSDESILWHRRLGHINFKNINKLVKDNLVRGLQTKHFENDQTCVACLKRKQHRASCKSKVLNLITKPLFMLYMDLFGPTFVSSLMRKKYCLVVTDDYSRFTWVFFLTSKDETSEILKNFIKEIENLVYKKVKIIRCDNGTEFKNKVMDDFYKEKDDSELLNDVNAVGKSNTASPVVITELPKALLIIRGGREALQERTSAIQTSTSLDLVYQMDVRVLSYMNSLRKDVYVAQPPGFKDPDHPNKVYKVVKALYVWLLSVDLEKLWSRMEMLDDVDVHLYRSMIGSLMYLTVSRPDIMFTVCACARFQVTPKTSHLLAVKRIFRYLKGKPTLGLWYSRDSPFELCKKQTVVATSTTEAEYVAAASCYLLTKGFDAGRFQYLVSKNYYCQANVNVVKMTWALKLVVRLSIRSWVTEWKRATTTASSLEAVAGCGSGPRCQDTILGDVNAQTRFEITSKQSIDPPLLRGYTLGSGEDNMKLIGIDGILLKLVLPVFVSAIKRMLMLSVQVSAVEELARMGYEKPSQKLTFYKAFFSPQWKYFIHTITQCLSAKSTAWNEFSSSMGVFDHMRGQLINIDADVDVSLVDETQERQDDDLMFDTGVLEDDEITAGEAVTTASVDDSDVPTTIEEITLAQTLIHIKAAKPKVFTTAATTATTTRPNDRGVVVQEPSEFKVPQETQPSNSKDKGKDIMIEPEVPLKRKDQIALDEHGRW